MKKRKDYSIYIMYRHYSMKLFAKFQENYTKDSYNNRYTLFWYVFYLSKNNADMTIWNIEKRLYDQFSTRTVINIVQKDA